jgi:hypothetical protein
MPTPTTLKTVRQLHHYSGVFIAPAVLFFAITGALQTFSLHETTRGSSYIPPAILVHLAQLHKKATWTIPVRKPAKVVATPDPTAPNPTAPNPTAPRADQAIPHDSAPKPAAAPAPKPVEAPQPSHLPLKIFFGLVALGLVLSTFTGLFMAWKYNRNKRLVALTFGLGIVLPLVLLVF